MELIVYLSFLLLFSILSHLAERAMLALSSLLSCLFTFQISVFFSEMFTFQCFSRLKYEKLTDDGRQVMAKAHIPFGKVS
jgi:hypothetical protein